MKKIILSIILFLTIGCGVITYMPSWNESARQIETTEIYRDTVTVAELEQVCETHGIRPTDKEWAVIESYDHDVDSTDKFVYANDNDTTYTIAGHKDSTYIFTVTVNK